MASAFRQPVGRQPLRGEVARGYLLGSLLYSARHPLDLPLLAPRALGWYRRLIDLGLTIPFGVVLDLGWLLLDGEDFRFRSFFADADLDPVERSVREAYETRVLVRRLQEASFPRLRRVILDNAAPDLAVVRSLELLLRDASARLSQRFAIEELPSLGLEFDADYAAARESFESAAGGRGVLLRLLAEIAEQAAGLDLDRRLQSEDYYEIEHVRVFPRESLREVARRIKTVERVLGLPGRALGASLRDRALADTALESVGTYPTGGIAELTTSGPIENLVSSELVYLDPDAPVDPFLVRFAEGELLKYLRDSAVLRMLRRTVVFYVEDCAEFTCPVTHGQELHGTKIIRCLMGLCLALTADLLRIFRRDDIAFAFRLLAPGGPGETAVERQEILEVLHLLFREKEEQGTVVVAAVGQSLAADLTEAPVDPHRSRSVVILARPETLAPLAGLRPGADTRLVPLAVTTRDRVESEWPVLSFAGDPLASLREARERILSGVTG